MPENKLIRMKADTFTARLRLDLGFSAAVHVPEGLRIVDTAVEHLCDALCVDGSLDLTGCTNLRRLPARLAVRGKLILNGCINLTSLPPTVREVFGFSAVGCERLTSISPILECRGSLNLAGCTSLAPLTPNLRAVGRVTLSGITLTPRYALVPPGMPDTLKQAMCGKRLGDVVDHRLLRDHPVLQSVIVKASESERLKATILDADCSALVLPDPKAN